MYAANKEPEQRISALLRLYHSIIYNFNCNISHTTVISSVNLSTCRLHIFLILNDRPDSTL